MSGSDAGVKFKLFCRVVVSRLSARELIWRRIRAFPGAASLVVLATCLISLNANAQSSGFTYQGRLTYSNAPADGVFSIIGTLYSADADGVGGVVPPVTNLTVRAVAGLFTTRFDFDPHAFNGSPLYLELQVAPVGGSNYTTLTPRQLITSAPYAWRATLATSADSAQTANVAQGVVNGGVGSNALAIGAVDTTKLADGSVTPQKIQDGSVTTPKLANGSVSTPKIEDDSVTTPKIVDGSVTTPKIADGSVTSAKLAPGAVGAANIAAGAVTATQLSTGAAAANLLASGQSGVASGGVVLSAELNATNLINAGYVKIGRVDLISESWTNLATGPTNTGTYSPARDGHTAVWTGSEMIIWGGDNGSLRNDGARYNPAADSWTVLSQIGSPSARASHTAVWSGTEMIIWGGDMTQNTGARYKPATDSWQPVSTINAPSARYYHGAVWTGSQMVIWGGTDASSNVNTGGRYNPVNDTWLTTTTVNAPVARYGPTVVWASGPNVMIVWGGELNTGSKYNPSTDSWTAMTANNAPTARYDNSAVWTGSQMIIWGGINNNSDYLKDGGVYNATANTWSTMATNTLLSARVGHSAVWTGTRMLIWGGGFSGYDPFSNQSYGYTYQDGAIYNPTANTWSAMSTNGVPVDRSSHTAIWTGSEMIVWGGYSYQGTSSGGYTEIGGRYQASTDTWSAMSTFQAAAEPGTRQSASAIWTGTEMIVWGGENSGINLHTGARFDPIANVWKFTSVSNAPSGRINHSAIWTGTEMIIWGGYDVQAVKTGARYNPALDQWQTVATNNAPPARGLHGAVWTGSEMLVWGGYGATLGTYPNLGGRYNPASNSWTLISTTGVPTARAACTAVWTGKEMIVWGGYNGSFFSPNYQNTGSRYQPTNDTWTALPTVGAPANRTGHTAVWTGKEMIVWGGVNATTNLALGGRFDPAANSWKTMAPFPYGGRSQHSAIWTSSEMIVWGGLDTFDTGGSPYEKFSGRYDPAKDRWAVMIWDASAPPVRGNHVAVWTGSDMLVWGGYNGTAYLNTTYRYTPPQTMYLYLKP
ncbi:Kelch repeat-containing protein [Pedosphaera parvula Ellin514]|uniref:Kelch repeat-containing protein n=1 Tax=Pedosphaera parvula (strain Ellin514) TaxID=320771 RepID=B9XBJ1_PEDPL|nr:Kelch repeat-containing protein [Pedosphaera parvula Ellin514]